MRMFERAWAFIGSLAADRSGATVIEYALITFLVSLSIGFVLPEIGFSFKEILEQASEGMESAAEANAGEDDNPVAGRSP